MKTLRIDRYCLLSRLVTTTLVPLGVLLLAVPRLAAHPLIQSTRLHDLPPLLFDPGLLDPDRIHGQNLPLRSNRPTNLPDLSDETLDTPDSRRHQFEFDLRTAPPPSSSDPPNPTSRFSPFSIPHLSRPQTSNHLRRHGTAPFLHLTELLLAQTRRPPPPEPVERRPPVADTKPLATPPAPVAPLPAQNDANHPGGPAEEEARLTLQSRMNHILYRDRSYRVLLTQTADDLRQGHHTRGLASLHKLISTPGDVFVWSHRADSPQSARREALGMLHQLSSPHREQYERLAGAVAHHDLLAAIESQSLIALREVADRHAPTVAGRVAGVAAAQILADLSRFEEAAAIWELILSDPWHVDHLTSPESEQAAAAIRERSRLSHRQPVQVAASQVTPFHQPLWLATTWTPPTEEDLIRLANYQRAVHTVSGPNYALIMHDLMARYRERIEPEAHSLSAVRPIVVGSRLIVREVDGIACRQLQSGDLIWKFTARSSLTETIATRSHQSSDASSLLSTLDTWYVDNSLLGSISHDGNAVYFLDDITIHQERGTATEEMGANDPSTVHVPQPAAGRRSEGPRPTPVHHVNRVRNRLVAVSLQGEVQQCNVPWVPPSPMTLDITSLLTPAPLSRNRSPLPPMRVEPLWSTSHDTPNRSHSEHSTDSLQLKVPSLAGHFLLGPPACHDGRLYLLSESDREVSLACLDASTGAVLSLQPLALIDPPLEPGDRRMRIAHIPTVHDGIVYCPLPVGAIAAVEAASGSLCWVTQYTDAAHQTTNSSWRSERHRRGHASIPVRPIIRDNFVFSLPTDSQELWALHRQTGKVQWSCSSKDLLDIVDTPHGVLVTISARVVTGLRMQDGTPLWSLPIDSLAGTGTVVGDDLLLPTRSHGILRIDLLTGTTADDNHDLLNPAIRYTSRSPLLGLSRSASALREAQSITIAPKGSEIPRTNTTPTSVSAATPAVAQEVRTSPHDSDLASISALGNLTPTPWGIIVSSTDSIHFQCHPELLLSRLKQSGELASRDSPQTSFWSESVIEPDLPSVLLRAKLELALHHHESALARLRALVASAQTPQQISAGDSASDASGEDQSLASARSLLRRCLLKKVQASFHSNSMELLNEANALADSPAEQLEVDLVRLHVLGSNSAPQSLLAMADQLLSQPEGMLIPVDPRGVLRISPHAAAIAELRAPLAQLPQVEAEHGGSTHLAMPSSSRSPDDWNQLLQVAFLQELTDADRVTLQDAFDSPPSPKHRRGELIPSDHSNRLDRLAHLVSVLPLSDELKLAFARRELHQGRQLAAETVLASRNVARNDSETVAGSNGEATPSRLQGELAHLWRNAGLRQAADDLLRPHLQDPGSLDSQDAAAADPHQHVIRLAGLESSDSLPTIAVPFGSTTSTRPTDVQAPYRRTSPPITRTAFLASNTPSISSLTHKPVGPFVSVRRIDTTTDDSPKVSYSRELRRPPGSAVRLMQIADTSSETTSAERPHPTLSSLCNLAIIDAHSGDILDWIATPPRAREPGVERQEGWPSFLPLVDQAVHGLSLVDRRVHWTLHATDTRDRNSRPRIGPYGPGYLIVQTPGGLSNIDPATGNILWERRDIPSDTGLFANESSGIIGDDLCFLVFDSDLQTYRLFDTPSGVEVRQGRIEGSGRSMVRYRTPFGRRLAYLTDPEPQCCLRLWDPLTDATLIDTRLHSPRLVDRLDPQHLAFIDHHHQLRIVQITTNSTVVLHQLAACDLEQTTSLRTYCDGQNWFANLVESSSHHGTERKEATLPDVGPPAVNVAGRQLAFHRQTGRLAWSRSNLCRTFLRDPTGELPYLITLYRPAPTSDNNTPSITLEVLDRRTGALCGLIENLPWKPLSAFTLLDSANLQEVSMGNCCRTESVLTWSECELHIGQQIRLPN